MRVRNGLLALLGALVPCGCSPLGLIYTSTVEPLDLDFDRTPVYVEGGKGSKSSLKHLRYYLQVDWDSNGIGDIAKRHGFQKVYYADLETTIVWFGTFSQQYVHIYGE